MGNNQALDALIDRRGFLTGMLGLAGTAATRRFWPLDRTMLGEEPLSMWRTAAWGLNEDESGPDFSAMSYIRLSYGGIVSWAGWVPTHEPTSFTTNEAGILVPIGDKALPSLIDPLAG